MRAYVAVFLVATLVSASLTPVVRRLALRWGAVSRPGGRNVNERAVPRYGGIAICIAFLVALATLFVSRAVTADVLHAESRRLIGIVLGGVGLCAVGAVDDTRRLPAVYKLCAQVAAAMVAFGCGFRIDAVLLPLGGGALSMGVFALPVTTLWIVGVTNAINLIDGLDGLAGGVVFFAALTNLVVAHVTGAPFVAVTMSAVLGSVLGFLFFNFNPARVFMGDSGSYFLGFLLGTLSLASASQKASTTVALLVPVLALGLPIMDTLFSMVRRFVQRRPIFLADRGHIHHRLLDLGLTHRRAVLLLYGICVVLTSTAIAVSLGRTWTVGIALLVASVLVVGVARFAGAFERAFAVRRHLRPVRSRETEVLRHLLPDLSRRFVDARDEGDVWDVLQEVVRRGGFAAELVTAKAGASESVARWGESAAARYGDVAPVSVRYCLGSDSLARGELVFRWQADPLDMSSQTEILLQVVVDMVTRALARTGSAHAPRDVESSAAEEHRSTPALDAQEST